MNDLYWLFPAVVAMIVLLTGMIVYAKDPSRRLNQLFFAVIGVVFAWVVANAMVIRNWNIPDSHIIWDRLTYVIGFLIAPGFALLTYYLPTSKPPTKRSIYFAAGTSALVTGIPLCTDLLRGPISDPHVANEIYLAVYCVVFIFFVFHGMRNVRVKRRSAQNPLIRTQLKILQMGFIAAFAAGILSGIIIPMLAPETWVLNVFTVISGLIFSTFTGYAISKYGFMAALPFAMDQILQNFYVGIIIVDFDGVIVKSNPGLSTLLQLSGPVNGMKSEEFVVALESRLGNTDESRRFRTWFSISDDGEMELLFGEKPEKVVIATKSMVKDPHGFPLGRVYTFLDTTERKRRELDYKKYSEFYKRMLSENNVSITTANLDGTMTSWNKGSERIFGYASAEVLGHKPDFLLPEPTRHLFDKFIQRLLEKGIIESEVRILRKDKRIIDVFTCSTVICDEKRCPVGIIAIANDITELKHLTRELQDNRDHLEGLLANANDIIVTFDKTGKIMSANKMAVQVSGFKAEEWLGKNIFDILAPEYVEATRQWADECVQGNRIAHVHQVELLTVSGERIPLETSLNVIESGGEVIGVQAIARDLRQRLEAQHQIRELQTLNEQIIRNAPIGIATVNRDGVFTTVNPAFGAISGFDSPEALLGINFLEMPAIQKFGISQAAKKILDGETIEGIYEFRTVLTNKDLNVKAFGAPLLNDRGEIQGALMIMADLSREKELEKQLFQSDKLSSIGRLVSGVAHELNNPLTAIMGYSQLLSINTELSTKSLDMARKIQDGAERCRKIVENLLSFARRKTPEKCLVDINELLDRTLELRSYDLRVNNIEIRRKYDTKMRPTAGDPDQLQQVFLNLINNAFDAMHQEKARGILEICTYESSDNSINIEFIDDGPGIPEPLRNKIFDPFFTTKAVGKGTGLGLSLSYGIIQAHGGTIVLDTRYAGGAKFVVKIPIDAVEQSSAPSPAQPESPPISGTKRILLVDDEEQILECTKLLLERSSFRVTTAASGEEAKRILDTRSFDVIVSDLRMPGRIDGKELYDLLHEERCEQASRMIFITGDTMDADTEKFLKRIPNRHVKKPFTGQELVNSINAVMSA